MAALEAALEERQQMVQDSADRIAELEDGQTLLETQVRISVITCILVRLKVKSILSKHYLRG